MDGVSAAASILGIATVGIQISIKLITFSNQIGTAPRRIRHIGNDVSLTSGVLQQLGDLMQQQGSETDDKITIFSEGGLLTTRASATTCKVIFEQLEEALMKASRQIRGGSGAGLQARKVVLSKTERLRFPFLQPSLDALRGELGDARGTLLLILQVTTLAYSKKLAELNRPTVLDQEEQAELMRSILALHKKRSGVEWEDEELITTEKDSVKEGINGIVTSSEERDMPLQDNEKDVPGSLMPPLADTGDREVPDMSKDDAQEDKPHLPAGDSKRSDPGSMHGSSHDSIHSPVTRPPVCKFPWSYDGKDARKPRSRSRSRSREGLNRGRFWWGRRRSRTNSTRTTIRLRSRSFDRFRDIVTEAWIVSPSVQSIKSVYRICWIAERLPLKSNDVEIQFALLRRKNKKSVAETMSQLTSKEREFIDEWFNDELHRLQVRLFVVAIMIEKIKASEIFITKMPQRRIHLVIERHPVDDSYGPTSHGREGHAGRGMNALDRPTYIKVNRIFMDPEVLDAAQLPWEWDPKDAQFMIIKRWIPEIEQDRLFEETRKLRRQRGEKAKKKSMSERRHRFPWRSKQTVDHPKPEDPKLDRLALRLDSTPDGLALRKERRGRSSSIIIDANRGPSIERFLKNERSDFEAPTRDTSAERRHRRTRLKKQLTTESNAINSRDYRIPQDIIDDREAREKGPKQRPVLEFNAILRTRRERSAIRPVGFSDDAKAPELGENRLELDIDAEDEAEEAGGIVEEIEETEDAGENEEGYGEEEVTGQEIIDGLLGKYTTLFDPAGAGGTETETRDGVPQL